MKINKPLTLVEAARMGGIARAKKLSPERRSEIAKKAVQARETNRNNMTNLTISADTLEKMRKCNHEHVHEDTLIGHVWIMCDNCGKAVAVKAVAAREAKRNKS